MAKELIPHFQGYRIALDARPEEEKKRAVRDAPFIQEPWLRNAEII